ncbi:MAG: type II toxin-antitoxin system prevent-host-death family antitoxin [Acidobacteriaceae bacterium]|jgi:prevent-host-death family protein
MRSVNIAELKNRLSAYVKYAKAGETIVIRDRNTPVARLVPFVADDGLSDEERQLVADGILRPGRRPRDLSRLWSMPEAKVSSDSAIQAILDERNEGL